MKKIVSVLLIIFGISYAQNDFSDVQKVEGKYQNDFYTFDALYLGQVGNEHLIAASTAVVMNDCSGTIRGIGVFKEKKITFSPLYDDVLNDKSYVFPKDVQLDVQCSVMVEFSDDLQTITVDSDGCMRYSGVSCGWEGGHKLMKKYK